MDGIVRQSYLPLNQYFPRRHRALYFHFVSLQKQQADVPARSCCINPLKDMVEMKGLELDTDANRTLSQLSYIPYKYIVEKMVGNVVFEPTTST